MKSIKNNPKIIKDVELIAGKNSNDSYMKQSPIGRNGLNQRQVFEGAIELLQETT